MIDAKIIGMSEMKKYRRTEVFWNIIVELMAGIQSSYGHCKTGYKNDSSRTQSDENLKSPTAIEFCSFSFFTLKQMHKKGMMDGQII